MWSRLSAGFALIIVLAAVDAAAAATYVVGDDTLGWSVPPGGPAAYTTWASRHVFRVGDVLVFNFSTGTHNVAQVTRAAYDGCNATSPIMMATVGPARITLNSTGEHYYICTFSQHCPLGQKLAINVTAGTTTSPSPAPAPAPGPTITPSPTSSPTPSPGPAGPTISPSPAPGGATAISPVPSSASGSSPQSAPPPSTLPADGLTPPPAPSSATVETFSALFVVLALTAYGLLI